MGVKFSQVFPVPGGLGKPPAFVSRFCRKGTIGEKAACFRRAFQRGASQQRFFLMPKWGATLTKWRASTTKSSNVAKLRAEIHAGAKALRGQMSHNFKRGVPSHSNYKAFQAHMVRSQAMRVYSALVGMGTLSEAELKLGAVALAARFKDVGSLVELALGVLVDIWKQLPQKSKPMPIAEEVCKLFMHQNYIVARSAMAVFGSVMAKDVPTQQLKGAIKILEGRIKSGTTYMQGNQLMGVRVPALKPVMTGMVMHLKTILKQRQSSQKP